MESQSVGLNLLSKILQENRVQTFLKLNRTYLSQHELAVYDFVENYFTKYGSLPSLKLTASKKEIKPVNKTDVIGYFYDEYINRALYNGLVKVLGKTKDLISCDSPKPKEAINAIKDFLSSTDRIRTDNDGELVTIKDLGANVLDFIREARFTEGLTGVPSGWATLDAQTHGFQRGGLYVISARVKLGKSMAMIFLSNAMHNGGHIPLFISMEMKAIEIALRYYAMRAGINMNMLNSGQISTVAEQKIKNVVSELEGIHPFYFIEGQFKKEINDISSLVYGLQPSAILIDGGYLVKMLGTHRMPRWERVSEIAESLKTLAIKSNIPIIVSFQLNREATKAKDIGFEHFQLSDAIGQIASAAISILKEAPRDTNQTIPVDKLTRYVNIIGGRSGETGGFYINWDWERMNFDETT